MIIPALSPHLQRAEFAKGDYLTEQEFIDVRAAAPAMAMLNTAYDVVMDERGFADIDSYEEYLAFSKHGEDLGRPIMWGPANT